MHSTCSTNRLSVTNVHIKRVSGRATGWLTHRAVPDAARRGHGAVTHVWQVQTHAVQSHPAQSCTAGSGLVRSRVLRNHKGVWRIRHIQPSDLLDVAELQASSFHESLPMDVFDRLAYTMFKAEVLDALKKKLPVLEQDSFVMLVVEELELASSSAAAAGSGAAGSVTSSSSIDCSDSDWECSSEWDVQDTELYGDQQAAAAPAGSLAAVATSNSNLGSNPGSSPRWFGRIIGVVEVGLQDEANVLQHLPSNTANYAYISSMAVAPHARRAGIGCALLQAAEQQAALWQQQLISLHVYDTNAAAIKLYEKYGLQVLATDSMLMRIIGGKVRHLMVKEISAAACASRN